MNTIRSLFLRTGVTFRIAIVGFLMALFGVVAPFQITNFLIFSSLAGTAYAGLYGMFIGGAIFSIIAIPLAIIINVLGLIYLNKYFKKNNIKNFSWFVVSSIIFLFLVYPTINIGLNNYSSLLFGFRSLYIFPVVFVVNYLVFGKINISTKYFGAGTVSFIIWFFISIILILGIKFIFKIYDDYMMNKVRIMISTLEIIQDPVTFTKVYVPPKSSVRIKKDSDGFPLSPIYPYNNLRYPKKNIMESYTSGNCDISKSLRKDEVWKVFFVEIEKVCKFSIDVNYYGPYRYPDNYIL